MREAQFDRFYVEDDDLDRYGELKQKEEIFFLKTQAEVFLLSACIGYHCNLREELSKPHQLVQKTSVLNLNHAQTIYDAFKCIAARNGELDDDGKVRVRQIMEEYAKGGFQKLWNDILGDAPNQNEAIINYVMLYLNG